MFINAISVVVNLFNLNTLDMEAHNLAQFVYAMGMQLQAYIEVQGMIAENKQRELNGEALAYDNAAFQDVILEHGIHHNALVEMMQQIGGY